MADRYYWNEDDDNFVIDEDGNNVSWEEVLFSGKEIIIEHKEV